MKRTIARTILITLLMSSLPCTAQISDINPIQSKTMSNKNSRYEISNIQLEVKRVMDLPINNDVICEFYVRLFSLLGQEPAGLYEGFIFQIHDKQNDFYFEASLTGFGPGYFAEANTKKIQKLLSEFNTILYAEDLKLEDCSLTYEHDYGSTTYSCKNGVLKCE